MSSGAVVLLVDDERAVLEGLSLLLRPTAYQVLTAVSSAEALACLSRRRVDVVVSDEQMPGTSGSELLAVIAERYPRTARILLTGRPTVEAAVTAVNRGRIARFLRKPCTPVELLEAIDHALARAALDAAASRVLAAAPDPEQIGFGALDRAATDRLSPREQEVLRWLLEGRRVSQIARDLFLSPHTVRNHLRAIFAVLGVHSQTELLELARGRG